MPRLVGYFWKVTGTRPGCNCRTYFCHVAKTEKEAMEYAEVRGWRNVTAEKWPEWVDSSVSSGFKLEAKLNAQMACPINPKEGNNAQNN